MKHYIAVDLTSIVKLDNTIKTLDNIKPSFTENSIIDNNSLDVIKYAVKAGKLLPIYIGQVAPIFYTSTVEATRKLGIQRYVLEYFTFSKLCLKDFKQNICNKYNIIKFAYDKSKSNSIWKNNNIEVLD